MGKAYADTLCGKPKWYFRRVEPKRVRRWFRTRMEYQDTGEIWEPKEGCEFEVVEA